MDIWSRVDKLFFAKRGIDRPRDYLEAVIAMHFDEAAVYTIQRFGLKETPEAIKEEWLSLASHAYANDVEMKPGAREYLSKLQAKGCKMAVATSLPDVLMKIALQKHEIYHIFDAICTAQEVGSGKAKPDIFLLAAKKLGVSPTDCILFDDILVAAKSAKSIGMTVCAMYDKHSQDHWEEIKKTADYTATSFEALPFEFPY